MSTTYGCKSKADDSPWACEEQDYGSGNLTQRCLTDGDLSNDENWPDCNCALMGERVGLSQTGKYEYDYGYDEYGETSGGSRGEEEEEAILAVRRQVVEEVVMKPRRRARRRRRRERNLDQRLMTNMPTLVPKMEELPRKMDLHRMKRMAKVSSELQTAFIVPCSVHCSYVSREYLIFSCIVRCLKGKERHPFDYKKQDMEDVAYDGISGCFVLTQYKYQKDNCKNSNIHYAVLNVAHVAF